MNPRKDWMSQILWGTGHAWIVDTLDGSILSPSGDNTKPKYSTMLVWKVHFFGLANKLALRSHRRISRTCKRCSSSKSEYMRMLSK